MDLQAAVALHELAPAAPPTAARLEALLAAAGEIQHAVATYALPEGNGTDPLASLLAELRIALLRVSAGPDAAELVLLAYARLVHTQGGRIFLVGSTDGWPLRRADRPRPGRATGLGVERHDNVSRNDMKCQWSWVA